MDNRSISIGQQDCWCFGRNSTTKLSEESSLGDPEDAHAVCTLQADMDPVLAICLGSWSTSVVFLKLLTICEQRDDLGEASADEDILVWLIELGEAAFVACV